MIPILLLVLALSAPALAYLDPGSGNILVQFVLGCLAALAVAWSSLKGKVSSMFGRRRVESPPAENGDSKPADDA
ncbi:MAG: hypothetical protein HY319_21215 [Armatimonadetes bacterium]|nr:hypothetical protein [Armatimonadota bacterium]